MTDVKGDKILFPFLQRISRILTNQMGRKLRLTPKGHCDSTSDSDGEMLNHFVSSTTTHVQLRSTSSQDTNFEPDIQILPKLPPSIE